MKIQSQILIEYLGVEDTDELNFNSAKMGITSEILDNPEALEEYGQILKSFNEIDTIFIKINKSDPELTKKVASILPPNVKEIIMFGECHDQDLDFSSDPVYDSLEELYIIKDFQDEERDESEVECGIGDVKLPRRLKKLLINNLDSLGEVTIPDSIKNSLVIVPAGSTIDIEGLSIPDVKRIGMTLIKPEKLGKLREIFPDIQTVRQGSGPASKEMSLEKAQSYIDKIQTIITDGKFRGSRAEIKKLVIFAHGNAEFSRRMHDFIIRDDEIIDTAHFSKVSVDEFDFDRLGDEKYAKIILKDASELSTEKAEQLLEEARRRGVKLAVQFEDKNIGSSAMAPQTLETYTECSKIMDQIIDEALSSLPENASEKEKYARLYEIVSSKYFYDRNALAEVNPIESILRTDSSRNITGLLSGEVVCAGYAEIMRNLARRIGIECEYDYGDSLSLASNPEEYDTIIGTIEDGRKVVSGGHAWVRVKLDGVWHLSDPTWDHSRIRGGKVPIYMAFTEEQGRKAGRRSQCEDMPECDTKMPREELAALYPHLNPIDVFSLSDAELYEMDPGFKDYTGAEPAEEDYQKPDSEVVRNYLSSLPKEPVLSKMAKAFKKRF